MKLSIHPGLIKGISPLAAIIATIISDRFLKEKTEPLELGDLEEMTGQSEDDVIKAFKELARAGIIEDDAYMKDMVEIRITGISFHTKKEYQAKVGDVGGPKPKRSSKPKAEADTPPIPGAEEFGKEVDPQTGEVLS